MLQPKAIDLADVAGRDKGLDAFALEKLHQIREFLLCKKRLDFYALLPCVASHHFIKAATTPQFVDDETTDLVVVRGDNADPFALVQTGGEVVHDKTVDPRADKADDHHLERIDGESGAADHRSGHRD